MARRLRAGDFFSGRRLLVGDEQDEEQQRKLTKLRLKSTVQTGELAKSDANKDRSTQFAPKPWIKTTKNSSNREIDPELDFGAIFLGGFSKLWEKSTTKHESAKTESCLYHMMCPRPCLLARSCGLCRESEWIRRGTEGEREEHDEHTHTTRR